MGQTVKDMVDQLMALDAAQLPASEMAEFDDYTFGVIASLEYLELIPKGSLDDLAFDNWPVDMVEDRVGETVRANWDRVFEVAQDA